jgi:hypothetical protein
MRLKPRQEWDAIQKPTLGSFRQFRRRNMLAHVLHVDLAIQTPCDVVVSTTSSQPTMNFSILQKCRMKTNIVLFPFANSPSVWALPSRSKTSTSRAGARSSRVSRVLALSCAGCLGVGEDIVRPLYWVG